MTRRRDNTARRGGGFTLIEVILAATLSAIVLIACLGFFALIGRSDERQVERLDQTIQFQRAYRTIERALQLLVMSQGAVSEDDLRTRFSDFRTRVDEDRPDDVGDEDARPRFWLHSDPQVLEVALRGPPVVGGGAPQALDYLSAAAAGPQRARDRREASSNRRASGGAGGGGGRGTGRSGDASSGSEMSGSSRSRSSRRSEGSGSRGSDSRRDRSERDGGSSDRDAAARGRDQIDEDLEAWIEDDLLLAPGVWGQFVLLPDDEQPAPAEQAGGRSMRPVSTMRSPAGTADERGFTLWWNELPPADLMATDAELEAAAQGVAAGGTGRGRAGGSAVTADGSRPGKWIRLVSGLSECRWEVYRQRKFDARCYAVHSEELPAFVKLNMRTTKGREEHWMFEVGWSQGAEPGSPIGGAPAGRTPSGGADRSGTGEDRRRESDEDVRNLDGSRPRPLGRGGGPK